jgi:hypothetical protein
MFMAMFHYAADGSPTWQVVQNNMDSSGNITGADFRKYANGQTLTSAYVSPAAPVADGTVSTSFGNPCGGALTINALPSIQLQRYGFADLTNGAECRVRAAANANGTPWANAGMSQSVTAGSTVTLDGSASSDPNGDPLTYAWTLTSKPAGSAAALSSATSVRPTFTADLAGTYVASLVVNDGKVNSTTVTVSVTVGPTATAATTTAPTTSTTITAAATTTTARTTSTTAAVAVGTTTTTQTTSTAWVQPVANAGVSQSVTAGSSVTLNGSASSDPNGYSLTYAWTLSSKPAGSAAALSSATSVRPTFTADLAGTYVASLTVNNGWVGSSPVTVNITAGVANIAPVANPGVSQSVTAGSTVTLNGSASSDPNGDPLTYAWTLTSKPAGSAAALSSATAVRPTFTADLAGTYVASLTVNDGKVNSTTVTVNITAGVANIAPVANAGVSQSVTYLGESVTLDGSASSDANGDPLTYAWTLRSFPSIFAPTISGAKTVRPAFTPLDAGAYVFSLVVNDGRVSSTASTVTVTVGNGVSPTPTGSGLVLENVLNFWTLDEATLTKRVDFSCGVGLSAIDRRPDGVIVGTETSQLYEINPISGVCSARGKLPEWIRAVAVSASGQVFGMSTYQASRPDGSGVAHRLHKLSSEGASQSYTFLSGASTYVNAIAFGPDGQLYGLGITYGGGWSIVRINPDTGVTTVAFAMPVAPTLGDIDIDSSGVLRTMIDGSLYKFNITTGALLSSTRVPNFPLGNSFAPVVYVP